MADDIRQLLGEELFAEFDRYKKSTAEAGELTDFFAKKLVALNDTAKNIELNIKINSSGTTLSELTKLSEQLRIVNENLATTYKALTTAQIENEKAKQTVIATGIKEEQLAQQQLKTAAAKSKADKQAAADADQLAKAQARANLAKQDDILFTNEQELSTAAYNKQLEQEEARISELAAAQGANNLEVKASTAANTQNTASVAKQLTEQQKLAQTLFFLKDELVAVNLAIKENNAAFAEGSIADAEYSAQQAILTEKQLLLKTEIKSTTTAFMGQSIAAKEGTTILDKFTNIVQRMGLRMIANLIVFQAAIEAFTAFSKRMDDASNRENAVYNASIQIHQEAADIYAKEAAQVLALKARWDDAANSLSEKKQILKDFNDTLGDQAGKMKNVNDLESFFVNKTDDFLSALRLRAEGEAALNVVQAAMSKNIKNAANGGSDLLDVFDKVAAGVVGSFSTAQGATALYDLAQSKLKDDTIANNKVIESGLETVKKVMSQSDELARKNGFDFNNGSKAGPRVRTPRDTSLKNEQDLTKLIADEENKRIGIQIEANKMIADDESKSLEERLAAFTEYKNLEREQYANTANAEENITQMALDRIGQYEKIAADKRTQQQKDEIAKKGVYTQQLLNEDAKLNQELAKNDRETQEGITKIYADNVKVRLEQVQYISDNVQSAEEHEREMLLKEYGKGLVSQENYGKESTKITQKYALMKLEYIEMYLEGERASIAAMGGDTSAISAAISKIRAQIQAMNNSIKKDAIDSGKEIAKQWISEFETAINVLKGFEDDHYQAQVDKLEARLKLLESQHDFEIASINATSKTQEEANTRIAQYEAQLAAQKQDIANKERQEKQKQAAADKAAAITEAIIAGALAVEKALPNIPLSIFIGAIAAAQVARIIATPLPQYAEGGRAKGGPSIVGEKGVELVKTPSGKTFLTPNTATLMDLEKGSQVFTANETSKMLQEAGIRNLAASGAAVNEYSYAKAMIHALDENKEVLKQIRDKKIGMGSNDLPVWFSKYYQSKTS